MQNVTSFCHLVQSCSVVFSDVESYFLIRTRYSWQRLGVLTFLTTSGSNVLKVALIFLRLIFPVECLQKFSSEAEDVLAVLLGHVHTIPFLNKTATV